MDVPIMYLTCPWQIREGVSVASWRQAHMQRDLKKQIDDKCHCVQ